MNELPPINFLSLFSGIGGLDLGLERAGLRCVAQVEIDPFCRRVLAKHWPDVPRFEDVRTVTAESLVGVGPVDLIAGGFPCQDVSDAGLRVGIGGERSGLWGQMWRLVRDIRPRFLLVENVSGLLRRGMDRVLGDLAGVGLDAEWESLPASAFGAPHERDRVFLAAYPAGLFGGCGGVFHGRHDLPRDGQWRAAEGVRTGREWKRWLVQACASVDGETADRWFRGVDDGLPDDVDRIEGLGNAVVPQVAEWIGRRIMESWSSLPRRSVG